MARKGAPRERPHDSTRGQDVLDQVPEAPAELRLHRLQREGGGSGHQRGVQDHRPLPGRPVGREHHLAPPGRQSSAEAQARRDRQERRRRHQVVRAGADQHTGHALRVQPDQDAHLPVERTGLDTDRQGAARALRRQRRQGARPGHRAGDDGHHQRPHADFHREEGQPLLRGDAQAEEDAPRRLALGAQERDQVRQARQLRTRQGQGDIHIALSLVPTLLFHLTKLLNYLSTMAKILKKS
jgi:hypothetical protein